MPDLDAKLQFLQQPASYGDPRQDVECIETHMSWVFLVGPQVFKLKKPVRFPYLDFSSMASRAFYCREEVRLNARLAPGVYLGVVALQWHEGAFALVPEASGPAPGATVDWLVHMRRLPDERTLSTLLHSGQIGPRDLAALADLLGAFYRSVPVASLTAIDYLAGFQGELAVNRSVLLQPRFRLRDAALALDRFAVTLDEGSGLLQARVARQRVVDGHGDLRPEHICLTVPPVVIDCLEFNIRLRQVDPLDELAYLGLECDMAGASWVGPALITHVMRLLKDDFDPALLPLYTAHRALLRARLTMAHLLDVTPRTPDKWPPLAERYIAQALAAMAAFDSLRRRGRYEWHQPAVAPLR
jgi:aminoglycoside phosphotransferase family enzyme